MRDVVHKLFTGSAPSKLGDRQIRVNCSGPEPDRTGDVVVQTGIDLADFRRNPVILFSHDPGQPIGRCTQIGVVDGRLQAEIEFAPAGASERADEVCALAKAGILSAVSIGFMVVKSEPIDKKHPYGPQKYLQTTLLEISMVAVPALSSALVIERQLKTACSHCTPTSDEKLRDARQKRYRELRYLELKELERNEAPIKPVFNSAGSRAERMAYAEWLAEHFR